MGGSGLIATRLGLELAKLGHDIHFAFYKRPFFLHDYDEFKNITFHQIGDLNYALFKDIGSPYTLQAASIISKIVEQNQIDILHAHYAIPHAVINYLVSKLVPVRTITTLHGSDVHTLGARDNYNSVISLTLKGQTRITTVSKYLANEATSIFNLEDMSINVIYDFINTNEFEPRNQVREKTIIQASNFRPVKQIPRLIEIFSMISSEFPEWKLKLVGNGPDLPMAVRKVRKLHLRDKVEFLGVRKDIPSLFAKSSILASTSDLESFGLTLAEGMATSTPVWAPNIGGIPELFANGEAGFLYDPQSIGDAADTLAKLMDNENLRSKMGKRGREIIQNRFSTKIIVEQYEQLYEETCEKSRITEQETLNFHELFQ